MKIVLAIILGFPALLVPCMFHLWTEPNYKSIKPWPSGTPNVGPYRPLVRQWKWRWLNWWYMNTEDKWMPQWIIALAWNGWRNNANNLKRPLRTDSLNKAWP